MDGLIIFLKHIISLQGIYKRSPKGRQVLC